MVRVVMLLVLLSGCYLTTAYEPAICVQERVDTLIVTDEGLVYASYHECEVWQALSDSTKRWDNEGNRLP